MELAAGRRVLVVDDEESIRAFVERVLRGAGFDVSTAPDGRAALDLVASQPAFDLFLLDLIMPQMTGDEVGRRVRLIDPDAKVLYLTGAPDHLFEQRSVLLENEAFVEKPVSVNGLLEAVSLVLFGRVGAVLPPS
jgi:two-component system cell cycle sensor histidine kinase/response regulator CckA